MLLPLPLSLPSQVNQLKLDFATLPPATPVVLRPGEIDRYIRASDIPRAFYARRFLTALRDRHRATQNDVFLHDVKDSQEFNWKVWVSQRPDVQDIVGRGIYRFAFVWLDSTDTNLKERRGDFLVSRIDGIDIRLHPQKKLTRIRSCQGQSL
mgnify:CR=1 FL=1